MRSRRLRPEEVHQVARWRCKSKWPGSDPTHRYNPLDYIRPDRGDRTTDIQNIATILVPESVDPENSICSRPTSR